MPPPLGRITVRWAGGRSGTVPTSAQIRSRSRHAGWDFANEEQAGYVDIVLQLLAVVGLVLLNGFFVATEFSLVSVRRTRIETLSAEANRRAQHVFSVIKDLDGYIAAT